MSDTPAGASPKPKPRAKRTAVKPAAATPTGPTTTAKRGGAKRTARKGKYNANGQRVDGIWFASAAEATRYEQLKVLLNSGMIDELECQVKLPIRINNVLVCHYLADFRYKVIDELGRCLRVCTEDVKGMITDVYALKRKMVMACHGIAITEIPARKVNEWAGRTA